MPLHETPAGPIETLEWGDGAEQIVLLHATASSANALAGLAACLARPDRRIIVPMLNGYGGTQLSTVADPIDAHMEVVEHCLRLYSARRKIIFGHSMGGLIALFCAMRSMAFDAMILFEPIVIGLLDATVAEDRAALDWDRDVVCALDAALLAGNTEAAVAGFVEAWNDAAWREIPKAVRARLIDAAPVLAPEIRAVSEWPVDHSALDRIVLPALIIRGTLSPTLIRLVSGALERRLPNTACEALDETGHMGPITASAKVAASVDEFLKRLSDR
jgi:pimeloyl-ACP methyl ester carboxylesterase